MRRCIHSRTVATRALVSIAVTAAVACSGGEKIVDPSSTQNGTSKLLTADDSVYMANSLSAAATQAIKGIRQISFPDLPGYGKNAPPCSPSVAIGGGDANGNGIPDDKTLVYTGATCTYTSNGILNTVSGSIRTQDLGGIYAFRLTYNNLLLTATKGDSVVRSTVNGTFEYKWDAATAASALDSSTVLIEVRSSLGSLSLTRAAFLKSQFNPLSGSSISPNNSLPSGVLTMTGQLTITAGATGNALAAGASSPETLTMAVSTTVPLTALLSCQFDPVFNAGGTLAGTVTGVANGTVGVRFGGCGIGGTTTVGTKPVGKR